MHVILQRISIIYKRNIFLKFKNIALIYARKICSIKRVPPAVVESKLRYKYNLIILLCDFLIEAQTG
jgi:chorismate-pyruvate lyase